MCLYSWISLRLDNFQVVRLFQEQPEQQLSQKPLANFKNNKASVVTLTAKTSSKKSNEYSVNSVNMKATLGEPGISNVHKRRWVNVFSNQRQGEAIENC